ncbi:hypothetical protein [Clostridium butyricum]
MICSFQLLESKSKDKDSYLNIIKNMKKLFRKIHQEC